MLNAYTHPDADPLAASVAEIIDPVTALIERAREQEADLIYINDNYGDFTAQPSDIVAAALDGKHPELVEPIVPGQGCQLMTKVRHSAFYSTPLAYLLGRLGTTQVIITGQVTEQCILYTALDAYVRHFDMVVPPDAVAHIDEELGRAALAMMERNMRAELRSAGDCLT